MKRAKVSCAGEISNPIGYATKTWYDYLCNGLGYDDEKIETMMENQDDHPVWFDTTEECGQWYLNPHCLYRNKIYWLPRLVANAHTSTEVDLLIKHFVASQCQEFTRLQRELDVFENFERIHPADREPIPRTVRLFVWQRDGGKCVACSRRENLEFDHIIPRSQGGSSTERNVQLLCESCNRSKSANI